MSQSLASDFPIDPVTTSGTALADILNRFADSVNTSNSGSTAPVDTYAGMLWLDNSVTPSVMRIRNTANTGWDTIPTSSQSAFGLPDGTVAAPGLAFASEPGLGWYRQSTGIVHMVEAGFKQFAFNFSTVTGATAALYPRAAGSSALAVYSNAAPAADFYNAVLSSDNTNGPSLQATGGGAKTEPSMRYIAANHVFSSGGAAGGATIALNKSVAAAAANNIYGNRANLNRWVMVLGNGTNETGSNAGSDFQIINYNDAGSALGSPFSINRATGLVAVITPPTADRSTNVATTGFVGNVLPGLGAAASGWQRFPSGGMMQWGTSVVTTDAGGNVAFPFPTPFASAFAGMVMTNGDATTAGNVLIYSVNMSGTNLSQVFMHVGISNTGAVFANSTTRVNWIAFGV